MADGQALQSELLAPPVQAPALVDHAPTISSPLNPETKPKAAKPPPREREQREKKDSFKKRESAIQSNSLSTSSVPQKRKASTSDAASAAPSPIRFSIPPPRITDYDPPAPTAFASHEPLPFLTPDGRVELCKPLDTAENKRDFRYTPCIADPQFKHKQFYRTTDVAPFGARMSFEDADKWMHFSPDGAYVTNEKGWRMARANVCAREGSLYYEVRIVRGVPADQEKVDEVQVGPQPHVRMGWARREAPLDAPVGFDGFSYGVTDVRFQPMHRSRSSKYFAAKEKKGAVKKGAAKAEKEVLEVVDDAKEGDVIGLEINLPSLKLHRKVVDGVYNPAVDLGDGFGDSPAGKMESEQDTYDVIRDRICVPYKGKVLFETADYASTKPMEQYTDRTLSLSSLASSGPGAGAKDGIKVPPNPNHVDAALRTLPHSSIRVYKNGHLVGTAFDDILAFLPPASAPSKSAGAREGFDDGMSGYFPAISCFSGGIAEVNFGDRGFWMPPPHLEGVRPTSAGISYQPGSLLRPVAERFKEQIAEDIVWDIIDEVSFFVEDGGFEGGAQGGVMHTQQGTANLKEEVD